MGTFTKLINKIEDIELELKEMKRKLIQLRTHFKYTPQEELNKIKREIERIEKRW